MGKTFTDIWLTNLPSCESGRASLVPSLQILPTLPPFYRLDDIETVRSVQKFLTPAPASKVTAKLVEITLSEHIKRDKLSNLKENRLFKVICLYFVKECIDQLSILIAVDQSVVGSVKAEPFFYHTLKERFEGIGSDYNTYVIGEVCDDLHKVQKDLRVVLIMLNELYDEINTFTVVTCINTFVENYYKMRNDEAELINGWQRKQRHYQNLQKEVKCNKHDIHKRLEETEKAIIAKTRELKDFSAYTVGAAKYIENWETSRQEQNILALKKQEYSYESVIKGMQKKMENEDVCHMSLGAFFEETKLDYMNEIEKWMERYDKELEERDMQLYKLKAEIDKATVSREKLQEMYEKRTKQIADWLEYKALKKQREELLAQQNGCAIKIQAWWRGVMVRKKLGPYRPKKKGKKGDKKNKKKKTKNK